MAMNNFIFFGAISEAASPSASVWFWCWLMSPSAFLWKRLWSSPFSSLPSGGSWAPFRCCVVTGKSTTWEAQHEPVRDSFRRLEGFWELGRRPGDPSFLLLAFFLYIDEVIMAIDMATAYGTALGLDTAGVVCWRCW